VALDHRELSGVLSLTPRPGAGLLFDIDGTLVDTDALHLEAFNEVFAPFGQQVDRGRYTAEIQGFANASIAERFLPGESAARRLEVMLAKEAAFRRRAQAGLPPAPGLLDLMAEADRAGLPMAAVTNAPRLNAELLLDALGIKARFQAVVIGEELARGKPDPLPYLEGLRRIGAEAERSVAFEDSRSGISSATGAGIATVGILTSLTADEAKAAGATIAAENFAAAELLDFVAGTVAQTGESRGKSSLTAGH
jgi:HAD superfamily hydrolase (TIGR01509 family)